VIERVSLLLKSRRQVLHRRVAEILRDRFSDTAAAEPEVLAHHFTQAGLTDAAIEWWGNAGDQALRRSAFREAISHLGKVIEMADKAGADRSAAATASASASQRLKLQTDLGKALMFSRGFGAEESNAAFIRARETCRGDRGRDRAIHSLLWSVARQRRAWRVGICAGDCRDISARGATRSTGDGVCGWPPPTGIHVPLAG